MYMKRGVFDVVLFLSLFVLPWWLSVFLMLVGIFLFKNFYEFIVSGVIIYALYIIPGKGLFNSPIYFSAILLLLYLGIQILRHKIILYKNDFSY
jgi:hypothetical protein